MDLATLETRMTALRSDGGEIHTRLAELEARLQDWLQVIQEAQLLPPEVLAPPPTGSGLSRTSMTTAPPGALAAAAVEENGPTTAGSEPDALNADPTAAGDAAEAGLDDEDERLLEDVDADTANAVRVKRRLLKNRRSVRELLDEMRATRPPGDPEGKGGRSWWRR